MIQTYDTNSNDVSQICTRAKGVHCLTSSCCCSLERRGGGQGIHSSTAAVPGIYIVVYIYVQQYICTPRSVVWVEYCCATAVLCSLLHTVDLRTPPPAPIFLKLDTAVVLIYGGMAFALTRELRTTCQLLWCEIVSHGVQLRTTEYFVCNYDDTAVAVCTIDAKYICLTSSLCLYLKTSATGLYTQE